MASAFPQISTGNRTSHEAARRAEDRDAADRIDAPTPIRYWHLASCDAPTVAVAWTLAFAWATKTRVAAWILALEALVVWSVYVGDRLLDARRGVEGKGEAMRERHWFHWRHRRVLAPSALVSIGVAAYIALHWMPVSLWGRDSVVGAASLAYFTRVHSGHAGRRILSKEMLVGLLFAAGCALPVWSRAVVVPAIFFAALAWLNCWAIERWEGSPQKPSVAKSALALTVIGMAAGIVALPLAPRTSALLFAGAASAAVLATLDLRRNRTTPLLLRALADLVLLIPVLLWGLR